MVEAWRHSQRLRDGFAELKGYSGYQEARGGPSTPPSF